MDAEALKGFMSWFKWVLMGILILIVIGLVIISYFMYKKRKTNVIKFIAVTGVFGAIAAILYCVPIFNIKLPFFPSFLSIHLDEIPIFIVGFAYGPLSAIMVTLVKTLIKLPMTNTACVGEIGDFLFTLVFVLPSIILYEKRRKLSSVFIGFGVSTFSQIIFAMIMNIYLMIPFYSSFYNLPYEALLNICQKANPAITDLGWSYALFAVLPMNLMKDVIVLIVTFLVYKALHKYLRLSWKSEKKVVEEIKEEPSENSNNLEEIKQ